MLGEVVSKHTTPGARGKPYSVISMMIYLKDQAMSHGEDMPNRILSQWSEKMSVSVELLFEDVIVLVKLDNPRRMYPGAEPVDEVAFPSMDLVSPEQFWSEASAACGS